MRRCVKLDLLLLGLALARDLRFKRAYPRSKNDKIRMSNHEITTNDLIGKRITAT